VKLDPTILLNEFTESIEKFKKDREKRKRETILRLGGKNGYSAPFDRILLKINRNTSHFLR